MAESNHEEDLNLLLSLKNCVLKAPHDSPSSTPFLRTQIIRILKILIVIANFF
ncbi:hypothetical protein CDL12_05485 [Handroanthus impetiginosus]|uniref:Uncharacterized protein n=1 Tax=Handroanthus impetiginosus TaxID=429701 RepID=A0A2G9HWC2_9LAMI|nr:hypothetical protein CDL12_05485 [Handroanthus impetiginosus]